eukprot:9920447-Alexandrium_andersonii.AAC.1
MTLASAAACLVGILEKVPRGLHDTHHVVERGFSSLPCRQLAASPVAAPPPPAPAVTAAPRGPEDVRSSAPPASGGVDEAASAPGGAAGGANAEADRM